MNFRNKKQQQLDILEKLVEANQDYLFRFAYFRVGSREVAEDIVQNVFLKLIENCIDLALMKSPRMYLFRMVSNRCIDYQRRAPHRPEKTKGRDFLVLFVRHKKNI